MRAEERSHSARMEELKTFLVPAAQLFFFFIIGIVWLIGFIRQRNAGFLLLALATPAASAVNVIRQAIINSVIFHSNNVALAQRTATIEMITVGSLVFFVLLWLVIIVGALLVVFHRPKPRASEATQPPLAR
jgi:hypothetical protein